MNFKLFAPVAVALFSLSLSACGSSDPDSASGWAGIAEKARAGIREEMATKDLDIGKGQAGLPRAALSPTGDLVIDGKKVDLSDSQRALLLSYRSQIAGIAETGAAIGIQGAALGVEGMKEAAKAAMGGDKAGLEARMEAKAADIKLAAQSLCDRMPALLESQRAAAEAVPEFRPYATMDEKDVMDCKVDN